MSWSQSSVEVIDYEITIKGTSTMHDWDLKASEANISFIKDDISADMLQLKKVEVSIPAMKLKSEKGNKMEKNTYKALKADLHPTITYSSSNIKTNASGGKIMINSNGTLTVAGVKKNIELQATGSVSESLFSISGSTTLLMTDYQIEPPQFLMGAFKTGDKVTIDFKVNLKSNGDHSTAQ